MTSSLQHDGMKATREALARRASSPYLGGMLDTAHQGSIQTSAAPTRRPLGGAAFGIIVGSAVAAAVLLLGASVLWIHYGTAVFFEMIATGIAACF
jgi:hypothetical protein